MYVYDNRIEILLCNIGSQSQLIQSMQFLQPSSIIMYIYVMILGFLFFFHTFLKRCKALSTEKYKRYINILLLPLLLLLLSLLLLLLLLLLLRKSGLFS